MLLTALGVNHQTAPLSVRERIALPVAEQARTLGALRGLPGIEGAMILSTCNRTELYLASKAEHDLLTPASSQHAQEALRWYLQTRAQRAEAEDLAHYFYQYRDLDAVKHVFRVATGLDSMVLGEPQILGQLKSAYADAKAANTLAPSLERLLQQSFFVAKKARTDTGLGQNAVSVASSAVRLAKQVYDDFDRRTALIIGAGETATLIARHLRSQGLHRLLITNRTFARAQTLAQQLDGQAVLYGQLERHLADADLVVTATASTQHLLTVAQLKEIQKGRKRRTLLLLDLSVPRNIEPQAAELRDVFLYGVDDLKQVAEVGLNARQQAAKAAELAIDSHAQEFMAWLHARERFEPVLALRERSFASRDEALAQAKKRLAAGADPAQVLERLATQLTNQLLHAPTQALRDAAASGDQQLLENARRLLKLD